MGLRSGEDVDRGCTGFPRRGFFFLVQPGSHLPWMEPVLPQCSYWCGGVLRRGVKFAGAVKYIYLAAYDASGSLQLLGDQQSFARPCGALLPKLLTLSPAPQMTPLAGAVC